MKDVYIVGLGAQTTVGRTRSSSAAAIGANVSRLTVHPSVVDCRGELMTVAMASYLADELPAVERMVELALPAIHEALGPLFVPGTSAESAIPIILGLPKGRPGLPATFVKDVTGRIVRELGRSSMVSGVQTVVEGHSAGLIAMEQAVGMIREGRCSLCLAGGCDSYIEPETLRWLDESDQLRSDRNIGGFFPGEGAGFCLLASEESDLSRAALAKVLALATVAESVGSEGASRPPRASPAWDLVLKALPPEREVAQVLCDINGQNPRSVEFSRSLTTWNQHFSRDLFFKSPAMSWGDVGAASGPLLVGLTISRETYHEPRGPLSLVSTSTEGGARSAILLSVGERAR